MARLLSGAALIALAVGVVWFAPLPLFLLVAEILLVLAFIEYARLAAASGLPIPAVPAGIATVTASLAMAFSLPSDMAWNDSPGSPFANVDAVLLAGFVTLAAVTLTTWRGERDAVGRASAAVFPMLYLGLPIGAMVVIRALHGREVLFLLMLTVITSDTAQYYAGRGFGRRPLAPAISPKKTIEGAIGGFVVGTAFFVTVGAWWLPLVPLLLRVALGLTLVALGVAGDLFESMLKRSAGVKDSSALIPGHGGVLDRIDALLFAAPIYYIFLKHVR
jgi:phosphatidate cytidylyltransferase